jgi:hypothetical protein
MASDIESAQSAPETAAAQSSPAVPVEPDLFAKISGAKKVRSATPKSAEPIDPDKFASIGGKFVGKTPERTEEIRNAPLAGAPAVSSIPEDSPFYDAAARVLNTHGQALDIRTKSDLWDAFAQSRSSQALVTALSQPQFKDVPNDIKHELFIAHQAIQPKQSHADKIVGVINYIGKLASTPEGKQMLATAEKHPNILRALTSDR